MVEKLQAKLSERGLSVVKDEVFILIGGIILIIISAIGLNNFQSQLNNTLSNISGESETKLVAVKFVHVSDNQPATTPPLTNVEDEDDEPGQEPNAASSTTVATARSAPIEQTNNAISVSVSTISNLTGPIRTI